MFPSCRHLIIFILLVFQTLMASGQEPVFSGPQVGESLSSFTAEGVLGAVDGKPFDFIAEAQDQPVMLIFCHERTRPAFAMIRAISKYAATQHVEAGPDVQAMKVAVIFLTDDATEVQAWAKNVAQYFAEEVTWGVSLDGQEGPGAYGLNRNMTLTVLIGKDGKVTSNFALVQPQLHADGPKILQAVGAATGNTKVISINQLVGERQRMDSAPERDPRLAMLVRALIQKDATEADVAAAAQEVEDYIAENNTAQQQLADITTTIVNSGKLENYGTVAAQNVLRRWSETYHAAEK
jgi:hypothetical protein